jgi:lipopolysaccharide/colanic/teichoic acid biosynthesis glycosyltransferase
MPVTAFGRHCPYALGGLVLKRSVDIAISLLLLVISFPALVIAAIAIKLDSKGPVLFRQIRMGRHFHRFQLLKLRTMTIEGSGPAFTLGADPHITRTGNWLRRVKLDELPQLWNVLWGEMSMVGPRPAIPELTFEFQRAYAALLEVRPGLTDPASLKYLSETEILGSVREPLRYFKTVVTPDMILISQTYLRQASVLTDLGVMAKTALALVSPLWRAQFCIRAPAPAVAAGTTILFPDHRGGTGIGTSIQKPRAAVQAFSQARLPDESGMFASALPDRLAYRHFKRESVLDEAENKRLRL